jgi:hypothetical protein
VRTPPISIAIVLLALSAGDAAAIECQEHRGGGGYWSWRQIEGRQCWYQGRHMIPKEDLHWPEASPSQAEIERRLSTCCWPPMEKRERPRASGAQSRKVGNSPPQ